MALCIKDFGLKPGEDAEVLGVTLESPAGRREIVQSTLAVMPVGRMADVVGEAGQVHQIGITAQSDGHAATDLGHLQ